VGAVGGSRLLGGEILDLFFGEEGVEKLEARTRKVGAELRVSGYPTGSVLRTKHYYGAVNHADKLCHRPARSHTVDCICHRIIIGAEG